MPRKIIVFLSTLVFIFSISSFCTAAEGDIKVFLNGKRVNLATAPILSEGRTLVPFRGIFEALGLKVDWDANTSTVTGTKEDKTIKLVVGTKTAVVDGQNRSLDVAPKLANGSVMVPLRFVAEASGLNVRWYDWGYDSRVLISSSTYNTTTINALWSKIGGVWVCDSAGEILLAYFGYDNANKPFMYTVSEWSENEDYVVDITELGNNRYEVFHSDRYMDMGIFDLNNIGGNPSELIIGYEGGPAWYCYYVASTPEEALRILQ